MVDELLRMGLDVAYDEELDAFSNDSIPYWKEVEIVVTNPPFKVIPQFFRRCIQFNKPFIAVIPTRMISNF